MARNLVRFDPFAELSRMERDFFEDLDFLLVEASDAVAAEDDFDVLAFGAAAGAALSLSSHSFTPWWPLHAPLCEVPLKYVPSLHCAIAPAGASANAPAESRNPAPSATERNKVFIAASSS